MARPPRLRRAVPPREVGARRAARCSRNFVRSCVPRAPHDPSAGDGHPRRQGRAPARRATSTTRPSTPTTRSTPRARSSRRARASCTWWTSTARARASRPTSTTSSGSPAELACRCSTAAACARSRRCATRSRRAPSAWCSARPPTPTPIPRRGARAPGAARARGASTSAAATCRVAGWTRETQMLAEDVIEPPAARGVPQFVYTNADRDGMLEGPDLDEVRRDRPSACAGASSTRAASARSTTCSALRSCGW